MTDQIKKETEQKKLNDKIMSFAQKSVKVTETNLGKGRPPGKVTATFKKGV